MSLFIVSINDDPALNEALSLRLGAWRRYRVEFQPTGFDLRMTGAWQQWLTAADLFLVGLERRYSWGFRAEGVTVADSLFRSGKKVLVLSGEFHARQLGFWFYWDLASEEQITEAIRQCLERPVPGSGERKEIMDYFAERLKTSGGH